MNEQPREAAKNSP